MYIPIYEYNKIMIWVSQNDTPLSAFCLFCLLVFFFLLFSFSFLHLLSLSFSSIFKRVPDSHFPSLSSNIINIMILEWVLRVPRKYAHCDLPKVNSKLGFLGLILEKLVEFTSITTLSWLAVSCKIKQYIKI